MSTIMPEMAALYCAFTVESSQGDVVEKPTMIWPAPSVLYSVNTETTAENEHMPISNIEYRPRL